MNLKVIVNALIVIAALVAAGLAWKLFQARATGVPTSGLTPDDLRDTCDEAKRPVPPIRRELWAGPLAVLGGPITIDGAAPWGKLTPGLHVVGFGEARLQVRAEAFEAVVIDARKVGSADTVLVLGGARCATCEYSSAVLDFTWNPKTPATLELVAHSLGTGDWPAAMRTMRGVPETDRTSPEALRLFALVHQLAGQPTEARAWLEQLPRGDVAHAALKSLDDMELRLSERQFATAAERWNAVSERYERLSNEFVADAAEVMTALTTKFQAHSQQMMKATTEKSIPLGEQVLSDATADLDAAVTALRARRSDCEWQRRVWKSL